MSERHIPLCWKCRDKIFGELPCKSNSGVIPKTLIGCKANSDIKDYTDAETMCPILPKMDD
jgi:hypothetical protein